MKQPAKNRKDTGLHTAEGPERYAQEILRESLTMLAHTGHSPTELLRMCQDICKTLKEPDTPFDPKVVPYVTGLPHVVSHWYSDSSFRDRSGRPRKLPLRVRGRGPSLENLIRRVFPTQELDRVVESLLQSSAIERHGHLFAPTDRCVSLAGDARTVHVHTLMSVAGMLRTVRHNITTDDLTATLLERSARNLCIPIRALPEIHAHFKRNLVPILWKLDGYLRTFEVEPGSEPTTSVGLALFVYEDPIVTGTGLEWVPPTGMTSTAIPAPRRRKPGRKP